VTVVRPQAPLPPRQDPPADSMGLPSSVLDNLELGIAPVQLLDSRDNDIELDPQLREDLPPLGGAGCEGDLQSSGNQMPISRSADSSESDPWTMLKVTSSA
jgi:hypothetical protein